uniref:Reverse transcriptase Ty1/copia-type domain-containing protein n=1 Tax=Chromera velia CCMP2878 TaxID=1169474 RepID=A0A0G4I303_9ALVE|eukprot:Cvel_35246.t1-p1 / transcript=Cvel_35246.t1 / gene=Cvel_35246 / organism=Chromera_velia_CCMP2878 / gene_product=hypothetical protein / transcript_product=hypothetical protein / location=Cvel_scaffold6364:152-1441(+) / protein_length=430 / sequence_SO=supercontig / SO=protein_coding / is_pseudo=false
MSTVTGESPMKAVFGEEKAEEISPIAVGDRVVVYDPHPIKKGAEPVHGKEGIFASVENSSVVVVLIEKGNGWKPLQVHPSLVSLVRWSGISFVSFSPSSSSLSPDRQGFVLQKDSFSDVDVDEMEVDSGAGRHARFSSSFGPAYFFPDVPRRAAKQAEQCVLSPSMASEGGEGANASVLPPATSAGQSLRGGHLEMIAQHQGGELDGDTEGVQGSQAKGSGQGGSDSGQASVLRRRDRRRRQSVPTDGQLVCESAVSGIWKLPSDDVHFVQEDEEKKEDMRFTQRREDENEKIEDLQERLNELKQKLARAIKEKEKARHPLPRVLEVNKEVVEKMLSHVNRKKEHIDATPEEVAGGSHVEGQKAELNQFIECDVFQPGVHLPKGRKAMKCGWVLTWKMKEGKRIVKTRLVVKRFQDDQKELETFSGMADW